MADIKQKYGTSNQAITITLASLANNGLAVSDEISNATNLFLDYKVQFKIKTGASGVSATGKVRFYVIASSDGGTSYPDSANYKSDIPLGLPMVANVNATTFTSPVYNLSRVFGNHMPERIKIVVENNTGTALDATEGNHSKFYQGVYMQSV